MKVLLLLSNAVSKFMSFSVCFFILFLFCISPARSQTWLWGRNGINVWEGAITTDAFRHEYITGTFTGTSASFGTDTLSNIVSNDTATGIYLVKYDASGNVMWAESATGTSGNSALSVGTDRQGNVFVTGVYNETISFGAATFTAGPGVASNGFLAKYDSSGNIMWATALKSDGSGSTYIQACSVMTDVAGNAYVSGNFTGTYMAFGATIIPNPIPGGGPGCVFLAKYSPSGSFVWAKFEPAVIDGGVFGAADTFGHIYICSNYFDSVTFGSATLTPAPDLVGIFIAKYDTSGNVVWAKNATTDTALYASAIAAGPAGNIFIAGTYNGVSLTMDTVTIVGTGVDTLYDAFIANFDSSGRALWARSAGAIADFNVPVGVTGDNAGNAYLSGIYYSATAAFGAHTLYSPIPGSPAMFVTKYDIAGNVQWAAGADASVYTIPGDVAVNTVGQVYFIGADQGGVLHLGPDEISDGNQFFLARLGTGDGPASIAPAEPGEAAEVAVFPNPTYGSFVLSISSPYTEQATIAISNILGEKVKEFTTITGRQIQVQLNQPPGIYYINVITGQGTQCTKIVLW